MMQIQISITGNNLYNLLQEMNQSGQPNNLQKMQSIKGILFIINQIFLWAIIIIYCVLSNSLFSTISLVFLIVSIVLTIAQPYHFDKSQQSNVPARSRIIKAVPIQKIVWISYVVIQVIILIAKVVIFYADFSADMTEQLKDFLQVQTSQFVFVPIIITPFAVIAVFNHQSTKTLLDFKKKINNFLPLPLYLILTCLIILIQIFSVSIAGLIYFFLTLYLFWMKSFNFKDIFFKILLIFVQVQTTVILVLTYLVTSEFLQTNDSLQLFQFFGINSINSFTKSPAERGHLICEILLSLMCACLNRLFIYQQFNTIFNDQYKRLKDNENLFGQFIHDGKLKASLVHQNQQKNVKQSSDFHHKPKRRLSAEVKQQLLQKKRKSQKVHSFSQQVELQNISQRDSFHSDNHEQPLAPKEEEEVKDKMFFEEVMNFQDQVDQGIQPEQKSNRLNRLKNKGVQGFNEFRRQFLRLVFQFFSFLNSPQFSLRVIELISIIVIQRFNNVYSFVNLLWLFVVASSENLRLIRILTVSIILPLEICNFIINYFYNIPNSPMDSVTGQQKFGFQASTSMWLDVLIFNIYLNYLILFVKSYNILKEKPEKKVKEARKKPKIWEIILAFCFRYTYMLTLIALFFLGFTNPTIMNILFVALFLIFFSNGDNLIFIKKIKNDRISRTITTFSKNYWFIIVYYTLVCIILKYIYFLFFNDKLSEWFDPTGINQVYNWGFNFSLSSVCLSNTTPLFLIFVLAQMQIIIYRSYIYTNYSYSIMADFTNDMPRQQKKNKPRFKDQFIKFVVLMNELYYQSLYYVSGMIIIGCSYRWSFIGLAIIILTCIGLLSKFNKKLLGSILFLNLTFLFLNYLIILINQYPIITQTLGQNGIDKINQISLFIGFSLAENSYASLFVLNVVIFYFCVICYGLSNILAVKTYDQISDASSSERRSINDQRRKSVKDQHRSFRQPTIVDSEFEEEKFAQNYRKDVIQSTKTFYHENLVRKYNWIRQIGNFLQMFLTDLVAIFVIIECLYFRLSISMFLFLLVYLVFYFVFFDRVGRVYRNSRFNEKIEERMDKFIDKEKVLQNRTQFQCLIDDKKQVEGIQDFIAQKSQNVEILKNSSKKYIWKYSAILSVTCLILTYSAQFLISQFYQTYVNYSGTNLINIILFVLGINAAQDFGNYVYFYYIMLGINILQKIMIVFAEKIRIHQSEVAQSDIKKTIRQLPKLENPDYLINCFVSQDFIVSKDQWQDLVVQPEVEMHLQDINLNLEKQKELHYQQANILIYFQYKLVTIWMNFLYGCLHFMIRFYLWLMLINVYSKNNVFAFAYLIAVLSFWFRPVNFQLIKDINKAAIIILLLQYLLLLLDINTTTSPISMPTDQNLSLLEYLLNNEAWVDFFAVSTNAGNNDSYLASFIINSIIIFLTELCFTIFQMISGKMLKNILQIYLKYENILQKLRGISVLDPIIINFQSYKGFWHRFGTFLYQNTIMNSYLIVSLLMFMLLSGVHNYLAIFLLIIAFLYIYIGIYTKISQSPDIFRYTRIFFRLFNILQFIIILVSIILTMPFMPTSGQIVDLIDEFGALTSLEQIFLILFIQLWLDLNDSKSFNAISSAYRKQLQKRNTVYLRCLTYQKNNQLISSLIRQFKEVLSFDNSIAQAMNIIKSWHSSTSKQIKVLDYDFQLSYENKYTKKIREQIQQQQIGNDHKQFSLIISNFIREQTDVTLNYKYYQTLRYVIENINGVIFHDKVQLSAWSFIKEDYDIIEVMIEDYDRANQSIINKIIEADEDESIEKTLEDVRKQLRQGQTEKLKIQLVTPSKLRIDPEYHLKKDQLKNNILAFLLSNIQVIIVLLIQIYYIINPCILSFPLIAFLFCYNLIANRKFTYLIAVYIFLLIIIGQFIQIKEDDIMASPDSMALIKFFFYVDTDTNNIRFSLGYLYFLFVVIFLNQEITKYKGNGFKDTIEVQNLEQAFLRLLMNEEQDSKLNLWKYYHVEHEFLDNINPFNIAAYHIENNLQNLMYKDSTFGEVFSDRKEGVDFYPPIAAVQIFLTIYLIFFYPLMTDIKGYSLQQSTKYYQFSSDMVIAVLVHVTNIVIERYITVLVIPRRKKLIIKYVYTIFIFLLFSWFIYYLAPYQASLVWTASLYTPSAALIAFSFFYFFYFYISALQIKYGYREFKNFNSLMTRRGYSNSYAVSAYTAIPFLYEIKIIMDWTFSHTSLTLYDWFRQFSIYLRAFQSKINYYSATTTTILGHTIPWYYKIMGWAGFIIILLIIFGPMILFSGLNPIAQQNLVTSGSMILAIQIINGNSFSLYQTSHFSVPPQKYNQAMFDNQGFANVSLLQQMNPSDIPQQFESITFEPFSDQNWAISMPNYLAIVQLINQAINQMSVNITPTYQFQLVVTYQINRQVTQTIATDTSFTYPSTTQSLNLQQLQKIYNTLTICNSPTPLNQFYISLIRLNTVGTTYKPRPIIYYNTSNNGQAQQPYLFNVTLNLFCEPGQTSINDTNNVYWGLYLNNITDGLILYVYCDKYQNIIGGYGFTALYTSIILVVAGFVRSMFDGNLPYIPYEMNPKPDNILQICQAINTLRVRKQFREQYLLYYQLIDIIRSPQIMKHLSGSYPYLIEKAHLQTIKLQEDKQMQKRKTL